MLDLKDPSLLRTQAFVDGTWRDANDNATFAVTNPADGSVVAMVAALGAAETRHAIVSASHAFPTWKAMTVKERAAILRRWRDLVMAAQPDLARILSAEVGKPLSEAMGEIVRGANFIEFFAEEAKRPHGDVLPDVIAGRRMMTFKEPIGVVAAITPWNFPSSMVTRKVAPALAAGCTVVLKPAEDTPLSALALAELANRAGMPVGVFNVIPTNDPVPVGAELTSNPIVRKVAFTGSTAVGRLLMAQCAPTVKKLSLELGGNAPFIVFDDADLDRAVAGAVNCKFRNAGQVCVSANRFLIQDGIHDAFAQKLAAEVAKLEPQPLINAKALSKVERLVTDAVAKGAQVMTGGKRMRGTVFQPTVLAEATSEMQIHHQEIFGPVAALTRFKTEDEAIRMANDTEYGLAAFFYSRDFGRCWRVTAALEYGMVAVNEGAFSTEAIPFGGIKQSGFGREGSRYGIEEFLEMKSVCMGGL